VAIHSGGLGRNRGVSSSQQDEIAAIRCIPSIRSSNSIVLTLPPATPCQKSTTLLASNVTALAARRNPSPMSTKSLVALKARAIQAGASSQRALRIPRR
jgi:hypothetical protein